MQRFTSWFVPVALVLAGPAWSQAPSTEEIWAIVQRQQAEIEQLKQQLHASESRQTETQAKVEATGDYLETIALPATRPATQIGGYGEVHYNSIDADDSSNDYKEIDFHRFVLFLGHEFSPRMRFFSEVELEHSIAADGEPGEVELEQAYVDFGLSDNLSAKAGLFLLPLGLINETHEPPTFYGVERNAVESDIIPATWWEAGAALSGHHASGLSWDFAAHSGLAMTTTGDNAFRVRSGRQKVAEASAENLAYTARLRYSGIPGLELAAGYQYQSDASQVSGDGLDDGQLLTANFVYGNGAFTLKGLYAHWNFSGAGVEAAGADKQSGWYLEPSYRFMSTRGDWGVYARYQSVDAARAQDQFTQNEVGLNYWPMDKIVIKLDYRQRDHDLPAEAGRDFDGFDLGLGYQF